MRREELVQKCVDRFNKILRGKLSTPLTREDIKNLTDVPFVEIQAALVDPNVTVIHTRLGSFRKYYRGPYMNFNPTKGESQEVPGSVKCRFKLGKNIDLKLTQA